MLFGRLFPVLFLEEADTAFNAGPEVYIVSPVLMGADGDKSILDQSRSRILAIDAHFLDGRADRDDRSGM